MRLVPYIQLIIGIFLQLPDLVSLIVNIRWLIGGSLAFKDVSSIVVVLNALKALSHGRLLPMPELIQSVLLIQLVLCAL